MKGCPQCSRQYSDETMEFCLEDGSRLISANQSDEEKATVVRQFKPTQVNEKTINLPFSNQSQEISSSASSGVARETPVSTQAKSANSEISASGNKALEIAPLVISLAHNWWQWIYLDNQYYSTFWSYIFSANFLMWMLLLVGGAAISIYSLRKSQNKNYPIISLIILSINLLLFLVPRR